MNAKNWRNPYAPLGKKPVQAVQARMNPQEALPSLKKLLPIPIDVRASVMRMRNNIKGISTTIRQMEETMDTLYGAVELFQSLGRKSSKSAEEAQKPKEQRKGARGNAAPQRTNAEGASARRAAPEAVGAPEASEADNSIDNVLANIDIGQILNLLQSPLVQNLIQQNLGSGTSAKRKKEG